jgi:conjugative transfer region protein TrbK
MRRPQLNALRLLAVAGVVAIAIGGCAIALRGERDGREESEARPVASRKADALDRRLTSCRRVRPEQIEALAVCQRIWADNRRRFFGAASETSTQKARQ